MDAESKDERVQSPVPLAGDGSYPHPSPTIGENPGPEAVVPRGSTDQNAWYRKYDGDVVLVFVHGIRSNSATCWRTDQPGKDGTRPYWPDLIAHDRRFDGISIYLGGYYADIDSTFLGIPQVSIVLYNALLREEQGRSVLEFKTIIFVCHSMGGIIVRNILVNHSAAFEAKRVGLILIASPPSAQLTLI